MWKTGPNYREVLMSDKAAFIVFFGGLAVEAYFLPWLFVAQAVFFLWFAYLIAR